MNSARRDYFSNLIAENSSNQRKLFHIQPILLLFEPTDVSFPDHIPPDHLANNFKWQLFCTEDWTYRWLTWSSDLSLLTVMTMRLQITWVHAQTVLILILTKLMCRVPKLQDVDTRPSFFDYWKGSHTILSLDPAPTSVVMQVLAVITCWSNMSFESGLFAEKGRQALILATLKKCGLDIVYKKLLPK